MTYLDANATEPLRPEAREAAVTTFGMVGNPASVHAAGRAARRLLEDARERLAARFGALAPGVVFTSGGTEADALAIHGLGQGRRLIVGATEHDAVRSAAGGAAAVLPVDACGTARLDLLPSLLAEAPALLCLMLANNETGTIQPVREASELCRAAGALLHVDAVQACGRIPVSLAELGAHSLAVSSHKLGGPPGAGALLLAPGVEIEALVRGGGQERGRRGGTPNLPAVAGFAAASEAEPPGQLALRLSSLRDKIEGGAVALGAVPLGDGARLPNTTCLALPGVRSESQVIALDLVGVQVSAGAACSSGKVARSHVLDAMGLGALAGEAIRVSLPWTATEDDADAFLAAYAGMAVRLARRAA